MMTKIKVSVAILLVLFLSAASLEGREPDSHAGTAGAVFLRQSLGARPSAMGGAYVAASDDVYAMCYNPAGLGFVGRRQATFEYNNSFQDISTGFLGYAHPLSERSTVGVSLMYLTVDDIQRTQQQGTGNLANPITGLGTFEANDWAVGLSYGRLIQPDLTLGVTGKFIRQKIDDETASGFALDVGVRYNTPINGLNLGASIQNIGPSIKFIRDDYDLPLNLKFGAAYGRSVFSRTDFMNVFVDFNVARDNDFDVSLGGEYWLMNAVAFRVGYDGRKDEGGGFTTGAGFHLNDLSVDYAYLPYGDLGNQHRFSASYRFGPSYERPVANYEREPLF